MKGDYGVYVREAFFHKTTLDVECIVLLSKLIAVKVYSPSYVIYQKYLCDYLRLNEVQLDLRLCELLKRDYLDDFSWNGKKLEYSINKSIITDICGCDIFKDYGRE